MQNQKSEPPLAPDEIDEWLSRLAPTDPKRIKQIEILLRNATRDEMTDDDKRICVRELLRLREKTGIQPKPQPWSTPKNGPDPGSNQTHRVASVARDGQRQQ